jgi:CTD kinase subunit gamma
MNTRANIMYFIEPFLEHADKERNVDYIRRMQRDIIRVVDAVCPEDGSGAANVKVVRKVLQGLNRKGFLLDQTVAEIEDCLKDRAAVAHAELGLSSPVNGADAEKTGTAPGSGAAGGDLNNGPKSARNGPLKLEKRQIEQRIEEDRERHKKRREHIWLVPADAGEKKLKLWEDGSDAGGDDSRMAGEEGDDLDHLEEYEEDEEDDRNGAANGGSGH